MAASDAARALHGRRGLAWALHGWRGQVAAVAPVVHLVPVAVVAEAEGVEEDTQGEAEVAVVAEEEATVLVQVALPAQALGAAEDWSACHTP